MAAEPTINNSLSTNNYKQLLFRSSKLLVTSRQSFTLVELLVVVALIAVLSVVVIISLNPQELIKQSRDSTRLSDLQNLNSTLSWFNADTGGSGFMGSSSVIYVSIPDTTSTCANLGLPTPPSGYSYHCVTQQNLQKTDGSGWIPVNFNQISFGKTLTKLPIDPINQTSTGNYYTYVAGGSWKLTTRFESQKYTLQFVAQDGGPDPALYELGTDLNLAPFVGGLVGYWSFDETGTIAYDYSGYANNGTMYSSTTITDLHISSGCQRGSCVSFDGVNDYVFASTNGFVFSTKPRSIIIWAKPINFTSSWGSVGYGSGDCTGKQFYIGIKGGASFLFWGGCADYSFSSDVYSNQWHFLAITFDGSLVKGYKDGLLRGITQKFLDTPIVSKMIIGAESVNDGSSFRSYFNGLIDEVRVYNRALSDAEIQAIYNATK